MKTFSCLVGLVLPALLFFGCKRENKAVQHDETLPAALTDKGDFYCAASKPAYDEKKYVHSKCDGAGFTSLYSVRCPGVELSVFEGPNGKPYRSPTHDCFSTGSSRSEFSRDMLIMRMVAAWVHRDLAWVTRFIKFASDNNWVMCKAIDDAMTIGRCVVTPALVSMLYDMQTRLEGKALLTFEREGQSDDSVILRYDFEAHLDVLGIWLRGEIYGGLTDNELKRVQGYADRENKNALFLAVAAKYGYGSRRRVYDILAKFPVDRLPGSQDWCTEYLNQRAIKKPDGTDNPDWLPCPERGETHSGTDYNFALYVLGS